MIDASKSGKADQTRLHALCRRQYMGVLGLTPFLLKYSPHLVKHHKQRFQCFKGKTIALDGTLLTHRFHFAALPYKFKHIYGWYRLITELRECGVQAICVFDGPGRTGAKSGEVAKRRHARDTSAARAVIEFARQRRLQSLSKSLRRFMVLPPHERAVISASFEHRQGTMDLLREHEIPGGYLQGQAVAYGSPEDFENAHTREDTEFAWENLGNLQDPHTTREILQDWVETKLAETELRTPPSASLVDELLALHHAFQSTSTIVRQLRTGVLESDSTPDEIKQSRLQLALTQEEGRIWDEIRSIIAYPHEARTTMALADLTQRSEVLAESYQKRSSPPPPEAYHESRMLIEAMGVPCIESRAPYEAEGVAASLVRHGRAHLVASEDTDVLVYGSTLLRNVTSRTEPLTTISSTDVRHALGFSRAAFTDFCLLLGTDFTNRLRNAGPVRALAMIKAHSRIERVVARETRYRPDDVRAYLNTVRHARKIFSSLPPVPTKQGLEMREVDRERVTELLSRFDLSGIAIESDWRPHTVLAGNYLRDYLTSEGDIPGIYPYK